MRGKKTQRFDKVFSVGLVVFARIIPLSGSIFIRTENASESYTAMLQILIATKNLLNFSLFN